MLNALLSNAAVWYIWSFESPLASVRTVAIWLTAALVIAFIIGVIAVKENKTKFLKISGITAGVYAVALACIFLVLTFIEDGITLSLFLPILILCLTCIAAIVLSALVKNKAVRIASFAVSAAVFVGALIWLGYYFSTGKPAEDNWLTNDQVEQLGLYLSAAALFAVVIVASRLLNKGTKAYDTKSIAYAAICIAMSFALSYLRIVKMPQGGSITVASLLPLALYSYMFGTKKGVFAGVIYGLLQAVQDPYVLHPAQFLLDYFLAFSVIGLAGMFASSKMPAQISFALGALIAGFGRFLCHFLSGIFAFGAFAPEGVSPVWYSFTYQLAYVMPDLFIMIAVGIIILSSKSFVSIVNKTRSNNSL